MLTVGFLIQIEVDYFDSSCDAVKVNQLMSAETLAHYVPSTGSAGSRGKYIL